MSDFRKCLFAFAVLALLVAVPASALTLTTCSATANNVPQVRVEGYTETIGTIAVNCGAGTLVSDVTVDLTVPGTSITSALDPAIKDGTGSVAFIAAHAGDAVGISTSATITGANSLQFVVPKDSVGTFYIRGVNVDATKYTVGNTISATVAVSGTDPLSTDLSYLLAAKSIDVALVKQGVGAVTVTASTASTTSIKYALSQCADLNPTLADKGDGTAKFVVNVKEGYATAWTATLANGPGTAGKILLTFKNIPAGVKLFLPETVNTSATTTATLNTVGADSTKLTPTTGGGVHPITVTAGTAQAAYVIIADSSATETLQVPVYISYKANANTAATQDVVPDTTVAAEFAPVLDGANSAALATDVVPVRFAPTTAAPTTAMTFAKCACNILFPYVTDAAPFDTGIAVSNTSSDPFGTKPASGDIVFNFYGTNAPAAYPVKGVAGGTATAINLSTVAPNFTGYVIAQSNFQYCDGFAMIMAIGATGNAPSTGYLGIVLPQDGTRVAPGSGN